MYAWYGVLRASLPDYKREVAPDRTDLGDVHFRQVLARHLLRYQPAPVDLRARNTFGADWRGELEDRSRDPVRERVFRTGTSDAADPDEEVVPLAALDATMASQKLRALLSHVLTAATPRISAPIYIGVATDLRSRLERHAALYRNLKDAIRGDEQRPPVVDGHAVRQTAPKLSTAGASPRPAAVFTYVGAPTSRTGAALTAASSRIGLSVEA